MPTASSPQASTADLLVDATLVMPRWIERGTAFRVLGIAALVLGLPLALPWHESLTVPVSVTSASPPRSVAATDTGLIASIAVTENESVRAGQVLGQLGTQPQIEEVKRLQGYAEQVAGAAAGGESAGGLPPLTIGGEVQRAYAKFSEAVTELQLRARFDQDTGKIDSLRRSIAAVEARRLATLDSVRISQALVRVADDRLKIKSKGATAGWVSKDAVAAAQESYLEKQLRTRQAAEENQHLQSEVWRLTRELENLRSAQRLESARRGERVNQAAIDLLGAIEDWQRRNTFTAPLAGRVKFTQPRHVGQSINRGGEFAVIVPEDRGVVAVATIPSGSKADVKVGAQVRLVAPSYPSARFGHVQAYVEKVSEVAVDGAYSVQLRLPQGLQTTAGVALPLRNRAMVTGVIRVRQGRIIDALLGQFLDGLGLS